MAYAAIDYFANNMTIPHHTEAPAEGTPLHTYIYNRQVQAHINTGAKFLGARIPIISSLLTPLSMDPDAELAKLVGKLNSGRPVPICMVAFGTGHHLVATGCNPTAPITITAYDPNVQEKTAMIQEFTPPGFNLRRFMNSQSSRVWDLFFVDTDYQPMRPSVVAEQAQWRGCAKCQGLYFDGHATKGACPRGGAHGGLSVNYWLPQGSGGGQPNWRWCKVCEGLFFAGNSSLGVCPNNPNGHDASQSGNYFLTQGAGPGQPNWRHCSACQGLFFAGAGSLGVCPKNPNGHDGSKSGNYFLPVTTG
jgi:hypothetical protein